MANIKRIKSTFSDQQQKALINLRKRLHQNPELSNQEFKSQKTLLTYLNKLGINDVQTKETSIIAKIKGQDSEQPPVAIRGDIDALPIQEATGHPNRSKYNNVMHACGHDVHSAWTMGAASLLCNKSLKRDVLIIFQQAEELATGAKMLLDSGLIPKLSAIIGAHVDPRYALGEVVLKDGAISSSSERFSITVTGKSGHAARPGEVINPIPVMAELCRRIINVSNDQGDDCNFITITQTAAGERLNIVPGSAIIKGTIRCLDSKKKATLVKALSSLSNDSSQCDILVRIDHSSPAIINDVGLKSAAKSAIIHTVGPDGNVGLRQPNMASEDFGYYSQLYPSWFFRVGIATADTPVVPVHTPQFYAPDDAIFVGAVLIQNMAEILANK